MVYGSLAEHLSWENHIGKVIAIKNAKLNCSVDGPFLILSTGSKTIPWILFDPASQSFQQDIVSKSLSLHQWYSTSYQEIRAILGSQSENVIIQNVSDLLRPSNLGSNDGGAKVIVFASISAMYPTRPWNHSPNLWINTCMICKSILEINNASTFNCMKCRLATSEYNLSYKFSINIREPTDSSKSFQHSTLLYDVLVNDDLGQTLIGKSAKDFNSIHVYSRNPMIEQLKKLVFKMTLHITNNPIENIRVIVLEAVSISSDYTPIKQPSLPKAFLSSKSSSSNFSGNPIRYYYFYTLHYT